MQKRIGAAVLAAAAIAMTFTGVAQAETNPKCSSGVTQMGATKYLKHGTETVASLKQFKGCNKNWAYVYVWDSWMAKHGTNHIRAGIWTRTSDGAVDYAGHDGSRQELWSNGANTLSVCTYAAGSVFGSGYNASGSTAERC
ncbi:hypothetical protein [Lentzea albidocapillata]|uniref:DUF2690 domain-containing protein n=1 Tax=Lentzea albidocapillata TaxID=40571 RepID=A0A1W2FT56_9PSEU|nr:hypothetical protein [Lentzea albidocapillata]SMD25121.1 hypothetical protein SAMN05660733_08019 [Lentzea albidocapillata]